MLKFTHCFCFYYFHSLLEMMDRLSSLPDEVLCHVLSFLTTKEAALTSVLAKRWRNLLAFVPNLSIDDSVFLHPEEDKRDREDIIESFMSFVDRVLALQGDSPLKKVSIKCLSKVDSDRVDGWIRNVMRRGVSDLDLLIILDMNEDDNYELSPKCFECSTLVKLKLGCGIDICWEAGRICLPVLKTFILDAAQIESDKFEILLHAMPALEELVLLDVIWTDMDLIVSSASVKSLTIKLNHSLNSLSFDTPRLAYFMYTGYISSDYPVVNMENLCEAKIIFYITDWDLKRAREPVVWLENDADEVARGFSNVWKLFHGIRNVSSLYLSPVSLEVLSLCFEKMPVYNNLKSLGITSDKDQGWQAMPVLLRNCPHLETLVIEGLVHHVTDKCGDACVCISREDKGLSLTSCPVKVLLIQGFRANMREMRMIKHFLDYLPCLEEMEIYVAEDGPTQLRNPEISKLIQEMFELYNKLSSCNIQLLVSEYLSEKWRKNKSIS